VIEKRSPKVRVRSELLFTDMVRFLFTQRRKKAKKVLRRYLETHGYADLTGEVFPILPEVRVFQLTVGDFERLSNEISVMKRDRLE
jgi:16S rRNA A1518/A1519 N6-dimethyltransferase RsmA/KsgA/DIM1 with predicted DNA glycosylase/AP lyase activity